MINETYPDTGGKKREKNEAWAHGNEKLDLLTNKKTASDHQAMMTTCDKKMIRTSKRLKLTRFITAWRELAKLSKNRQIYWAPRPIIEVQMRNRVNKPKDYDDWFWDDPNWKWEREGTNFLFITGLGQKNRRINLASEYKNNNDARKLHLAAKLRTNQLATNILNTWENRKLEECITKINKEAEKHNLKPAWDFVRRAKLSGKKTPRLPIKNTDGTETKNAAQAMKCWTDWATKWFYTTNTTPNMTHIASETWDAMIPGSKNINIPNCDANLQHLRNHAKLTTLLNNNPEHRETLDSKISIHELRLAICSLANKKSCGTDDIPAEIFKTIRTKIEYDLLRICNNIYTKGLRMPNEWGIGAVVYIFKKGDPQHCNNYRPICLLQIAYKIWTKILTNRPTPDSTAISEATPPLTHCTKSKTSSTSEEKMAK